MREEEVLGEGDSWGFGGDADYVAFVHAGEQAKGSFRCSECGYGVVVSSALPVCPMCQTDTWELSDWSPFTRAGAPL